MTPKEAILIAQAAYNTSAFTLNGNILSFPGTQKFTDFIKDVELFEICKHNEYPGLVHDGFATALDDIWDSIPLPPIGEIYIIGHSSGAALATLASIRLKNLGYFPIVYTFGSPKVGNTKFADAYKIPHYRWVNKADIVPHLPGLLIKRFDYKHVGTLQYVDFNKNLSSDANLEDRNFFFKLIRYNCSVIKDHYTDSYIKSIDQIKIS